MNRRDLIKGASLAGLASLLPIGAAIANNRANKATAADGSTCILIPSETEGPYPYDLSGNTAMYRQDITEGNTGTPLNFTLTIVNINDNCAPITNARVDIWHCNKDGYYSEFANQPGYLGTQSHVNETFFRGIQMTDANGQVTFKTIYPGWYNGRATHIHFQVLLNSLLKATSQAAFPEALNTTVYGTSTYSAHGQNSTKNATDNVFSDTDNTQYELLTVVANADTGGYDASLTVGIAAPATNTGILSLEPETGGQFKLKQNFPNPFAKTTIIPFTLNQAARVQIELYDLSAKKIGVVMDADLQAGEQTATLNTHTLGLVNGTYVYQIITTNSVGTFRQCKTLTVQD